MKIVFKSIPEFYEKEKSGRKRNTVRKIDMKDERFIELRNFMKCIDLDFKNHITIQNTETKEEFAVEIKDVSIFEGYMIISW